MKLKVTEIEASAEELRQSNSLADGLSKLLRNAFNPYNYVETENDEVKTEPQTDCAWK